MKSLIDTLVISGGGVKGIAFIGSLKYLEELNKTKDDIKCIYAISVGSIISVLYAIGYTSEEMETEIMSVDLQSLQNIRFKTFIKSYGLDSGKNIITWLESLIEKKGYNKTLTFKQLYKKTGMDLNIGATNLNKYKDVFFNMDISPNLIISRAVRMSIGIPLIFSAIKYKGEIYVDGGVINSYPIKRFDNLDNVLGLKLVVKGEIETEFDEKIETMDHYLYHVMHCYILQKERSSTLSSQYSDHTIFIESNHITHTINFNLNDDEKRRLIKCGYDATKMYFENEGVINKNEED